MTIGKAFGYLALSMVLAACVTINIYFPAAAAEEAAREIVRDVLKNAPPSGQEGQGGDDRQSARAVAPPLLWAARLLELAVPTAEAAQADIDISSPAISALRQKMAARQRELAPFYAAGAIGFDRRGLVGVRDLNAVPLAERNRLKKLVADANGDRNALYREIAKANGHPEWESEVRETFARVWAEEAPRGYWYQDAAGNWKQR